jgi:hypothetical protein
VPERINVATKVDEITEQALGRHVRLRAHDAHAVGGLRLGAGARELARPEIEHAHLVPRLNHEHVLGFQIAVDDAERMRRVHALRDLDAEAQRTLERQPARVVDLVAQRLAGEKLHGKPNDALARDAAVEHANHVSVLNARQSLGFAAHALALVAGAIVQGLERDLGTGELMARLVNHAHAARGQGAHDLVAITAHVSRAKWMPLGEMR